MTDIPTNALRQHLAEILRRVAAGESFRVTRRGRVLALLLPPYNPAEALHLEEFMPVTPEMKAAALLYLTPLTPILDNHE